MLHYFFFLIAVAYYLFIYLFISLERECKAVVTKKRSLKNFDPSTKTDPTDNTRTTRIAY